MTVSGNHLKGTTCFSDIQVTKGHIHCCLQIMEVVCRIVRPLPGVVKPALPALSQSPEAAGAPGLCPHSKSRAVLSWALPSEPFPLWPWAPGCLSASLPSIEKYSLSSGCISPATLSPNSPVQYVCRQVQCPPRVAPSPVGWAAGQWEAAWEGIPGFGASLPPSATQCRADRRTSVRGEKTSFLERDWYVPCARGTNTAGPPVMASVLSTFQGSGKGVLIS